MKFFNKVSLSLLPLIFISSVNSFAYEKASFITANSSGNLNIDQTKIISSNSQGEFISKLSDTPSIFQLSISEDNEYKTEQYAKITNKNGESIPVYSVPLNDSNILGEIPNGSTVLITKINENFARILFKDYIGFIETKYLKTTGIIEQPKNQHKKTTANINSKSGANFRQAPSESSKILKTLPFNTNIEVLEIENNWLKVLHNGQTGFINKQSTSLANSNENKSIPSKTTGENIVNFAKKYLGKPYIYGSTNLEKGTDCSGFTYAIFKQFGINLNRVSKDQYLNGTNVSKENLMPGDLVFFNTGSRINHVGIYIGNGQYIHSTDSKNQGVIISNLSSAYASKYYYGARRVIK